MAARYLIVVEGHLDTRWARHFEGLTLTQQPDGTTRLVGPVTDQPALHAHLSRIRDLGLTLVRVEKLAPETTEPTQNVA